jgi:hypothetical protein
MQRKLADTPQQVGEAARIAQFQGKKKPSEFNFEMQHPSM